MPDVSQLTFAEKTMLTAGVDLWHTAPIDRLGVPSVRMTDGPNGARGGRWSGATSACLPCGSALAATWNRDLVRQVGRVLAEEARAKGAQVLLAPTVNIHRHPLGGRHFESFSEDPYLSAEMAVAYISGVQERGVSAVVKHFVCNDQEHERHTISVDVDERALREIYLPPFEAAVRTAGVWAIMSAYNRLGGTYCSEHGQLLTDLLRTEWGFDGLVVSDWRGTHSAAAVDAGLDLEMPGPPEYLGSRLAHRAVADASLSRAAGNLFALIERTAQTPDGAALVRPAAEVAREAAREAIVLLRNDGVLPLEADPGQRIAVIGPLAARAAAQGGGSAEVTPPHVISPLEALRARVGQQTEIVYEPGCVLPGVLPLLDSHLLRPLADGAALDVAYFDNPDFHGEPVARETFAQSRFLWDSAPASGIVHGHFSARITATLVPDATDTWRLGIASAGQSRLSLDGKLVLDNFAPVPGDTFFGRGSQQVATELELRQGTAYDLVAEFRIDEDNSWITGLRFGAERAMAPDSIARAAAAAANADAVLLVVGYDSRWESEGFDRPHMDLPRPQDELIRAVLQANRRTIVAVNAGSPVTMDWAGDTAALLQMWFPGQECGAALLDVLFGDVDASGRLPTTFPRRTEDSPAFGNYPGNNGVVHYAESIFVGYRGYDRAQVEPRFCFGHG
ncbi:MAG TPA: glycoside hydrolase family 3 C-terminal domain-containing protein, partial [Chloroflexota bacterium]|nr:glycoside hydrolase family 3 C-terminal domain-containing protein [Chloroflexota bacterium]